jgi:hypothetical protein
MQLTSGCASCVPEWMALLCREPIMTVCAMTRSTRNQFTFRLPDQVYGSSVCDTIV